MLVRESLPACPHNLRTAGFYWQGCGLHWEAGPSLALLEVTGDNRWTHTGGDTWRRARVAGRCQLRAAGVPRHRDNRRCTGRTQLKAHIQARGCTLALAGIHLRNLLRTGMHILFGAGVLVHCGTAWWACGGERSRPHAGRRVRHLSPLWASLKENRSIWCPVTQNFRLFAFLVGEFFSKVLAACATIWA